MGFFAIFLSSFNELQSRGAEQKRRGEEPAKKIARARPDLARSGSQTGTLIVAEGGRGRGGRASDCAIPLSPELILDSSFNPSPEVSHNHFLELSPKN